MPLDTRFCDGYLTIKPRKSQKGKLSTPRASINNVRHIQNIFHKAVEDGDITQVKVLLRYARTNIHLGEPNKNGRTALQECCLKDDLELIRLLLDHGASLESTDSYGWTALHYAAFFGSLDIVRFLVLNCADLTFTNSNGETAYDLAQNPDVKFYLEGMMMLGGENLDTSEVDEEDSHASYGSLYKEDTLSLKNESDNDSLGDSSGFKTFDDTENASDLRNSIEAMGERPPVQTYCIQKSLEAESFIKTGDDALCSGGQIPRSKWQIEHSRNNTQYTKEKAANRSLRRCLSSDAIHDSEVPLKLTYVGRDWNKQSNSHGTFDNTKNKKSQIVIISKQNQARKPLQETAMDKKQKINKFRNEMHNEHLEIHVEAGAPVKIDHKNIQKTVSEEKYKIKTDLVIKETEAKVDTKQIDGTDYKERQKSKSHIFEERPIKEEKFNAKKHSGIPRFKRKTQERNDTESKQLTEKTKTNLKEIKPNTSSNFEQTKLRKDEDKSKRGLEKLWERFRLMSVRRSSHEKRFEKSNETGGKDTQIKQRRKNIKPTLTLKES